MQPTRFGLVINHQIARILGIDVALQLSPVYPFAKPSRLKWAVRALQVIAVFFGVAIVIGQIDALIGVDYAAVDWRTEFGKQVIALLIALVVALIAWRLVIQSLRNQD